MYNEVIGETRDNSTLNKFIGSTSSKDSKSGDTKESTLSRREALNDESIVTDSETKVIVLHFQNNDVQSLNFVLSELSQGTFTLNKEVEEFYQETANENDEK